MRSMGRGLWRSGVSELVEELMVGTGTLTGGGGFKRNEMES